MSENKSNQGQRKPAGNDRAATFSRQNIESASHGTRTIIHDVETHPLSCRGSRKSSAVINDRKLEMIRARLQPDPDMVRTRMPDGIVNSFLGDAIKVGCSRVIR